MKQYDLRKKLSSFKILSFVLLPKLCPTNRSQTKKMCALKEQNSKTDGRQVQTNYVAGWNKKTQGMTRYPKST